MTTERTAQCPICKRPYKIYFHSPADQSACPKCVREAEVNTGVYKGWNKDG